MKAASAPAKVVLADLEDVSIQTPSEGQATLRRLLRLRWGLAACGILLLIVTCSALAPWIALGMTGTTALIAVLTRAALKGERASAVQSATGFYYLAVVTAFTAELAVKTRFLAP